MRCKVNIILGFLGSGKTRLINELLKDKSMKKEKIMVLQWEKGLEKVKSYEGTTLDASAIKTGYYDYIKSIIIEYELDRLIIEFNGVGDVSSLLKDINKGSDIFKLESVVSLIDGKKATMNLLNIRSFISEHILNSDIIIITNVLNMNKDTLKAVKKNIKVINEVAMVYEIKDFSKIKGSLLDAMINKKENKLFYIAAVICALILLIVAMPIIKEFPKDFYIYFRELFLGILLEGIPFVLIGAFVSAIIQICLSDRFIFKLFPKNKLLSSIVAAFLGVVFPICDCGTIPIARGLLKKGLPISVGVTFMLAAPIVNPISIMSTLYVFNDMKEIAILRVVIGVVVAIVVGLIMNRNKNEEVLTTYMVNCQCELCSGEYNNADNPLKKLKGVFLTAGDEFISVSKYLIVGAFFSSIIQALLAKELVIYNPSNKLLSLAIMILLAMVFCLCSTSDAFVARGFMPMFASNSILGFLVVGPMIDIKNIIMLLGCFKKKFILKLVLCILVVIFSILTCMGMLQVVS